MEEMLGSRRPPELRLAHRNIRILQGKRIRGLAFLKMGTVLQIPFAPTPNG
jgi:hypothetical protein